MGFRPGLVTYLQYKLGQIWLLFELVTLGYLKWKDGVIFDKF